MLTKLATTIIAGCALMGPAHADPSYTPDQAIFVKGQAATLGLQ